MGARIGETDIVLRGDDETLSEDSIADGVAVEGKDNETFIGLLESVDVVVWGAGCGIGVGVVIIVDVVLDGVSEIFIVGEEILGGGVVGKDGGDDETLIGFGAITGCGKGLYWSPYIA